MTRILHTLVPLAVVAAVLGALAGCAPVHGHHSPGGSPSTPSALVTGRAADTAEPQPGLDIDCAGLVDPAALAAAFPAGVRSVDPLVTQGEFGPDIEDGIMLQAAGGISCEWNNGLRFSEGAEDASRYAGLRLSVLPRAASQWALYDAERGATGEGFQCYTAAPPPLICSSEQLIGTTWVSMTLENVGGQSEARSLVTSINSVVAAARPGAARWTPPSGTKTFGECTQLLTPSQVAGDLGVTAVPMQLNAEPAGGWSIEAAARAQVDAIGCLFQYPDNDSVVGEVNWLRGGAWAYDRGIAAVGVGWGTPAPTSIASLASGDRAEIGCTDPSLGDEESANICTVDLLLGGNWIQVIIEPSNLDDYVTVDVRTAALAVASQLVSAFNAHAH